MNKMRAGIKPGFAIAGARALAAAAGQGLCFGLLATGCFPYQVAAAELAIQPGLIRPGTVAEGSAPGTPAATFIAETPVAARSVPKSANFEHEHASQEARHVADRVVDSADNRGLPFVIIDKVDAKVFVFDAGGSIRGAAPALLGLARGDDTVPGIGDREHADMPAATRTTPAGRFVAALGIDARGEDVLRLDYEAANVERRMKNLFWMTALEWRRRFNVRSGAASRMAGHGR